MSAALVVTIAALFLLAALYPGLRFTPGRVAAAPTSTSAPAKPVASFTPSAESPAAKVVQALLAGAPKGLPAGLGPASSVTGTVAPAVDLTCDQPVGPVLSRQRSWVAASGPMGTGLTVTASAYSAGAAAAAMDAMRTARSQCRAGTDVATRSGLGVEALDATSTVAGNTVPSVLLRRGDVLVSVTGARVTPPAAFLADLDARLAALLGAGGVCLDQEADVEDFARSVVAGKGYSGYSTQRAVPLPAASTPLPPVVAPSQPLELPAPLAATTPAAPYWPASAPAPVASPTAPAVPSPYPTQTPVPVPARDTGGPGCGWAFTGMAAPTFDDAAAERLAAERSAAAVVAMQAAVAAYPALAQGYQQAWSSYLDAATTYAETTARIAEVEAAWSVIRRQQADYAAALAQYQADLAAYTDFATNQQAAAAAYQQALLACATMTPVAPPPPAATVPVVPAPTPVAPTPVAPTPVVPTPVVPTPATAPTSATPPAPVVAPGRLAAAPVVCPPVPDPILQAMPPTSPVSPLPPPDPRPTPMPEGATP